ncbi:interleukin-6 receptor subunit beta [Toxotes jaculatrix]|uniref:interleukin-6 receptor subunit beta n=1 Tax=Toxotes jaculatrix TaxID=941984 RepID=UPI001B3ABDE3|nr:interleukin-6 receptor subunit beta [Toxotes jaculatrix]XP_040915605.1 interleukin-6 receptor subunit beta [Toxotes jaculatrix]
MVSARVLQLLVLACLASALPAIDDNGNHLVIAPQSPVLEIGTNFTATCMIINTAEVTADDLYWNLAKTTLPKEHYSKVNRSTLNVTLLVAGEQPEWLFCHCKEELTNVYLDKGKYIHGILLTKGYRPGKPENLSCIAPQEGDYISPKVNCSWASVGRQTAQVPITYTVFFKIIAQTTYNVSNHKNHAQISVGLFPNHMDVEVWVVAHNALGTVESEHVKKEAGYFVKTNPPADVKTIAEKNFSTSLLINWTIPIPKVYLELTYEIRFRPHGSESWTYVPLADITNDIQSFRLQNLQPDTTYVTEVRCKNSKRGYGYWSEWSTSTNKTPEARPASKPDLWKFITRGDSINERRVQFLSKDPVFSNGRIIRFDIRIQDKKNKAKNGSLEWESILVNRSEAADNSSNRHHPITVLKEIVLPDKKSVTVQVIAVNSEGESPTASLTVLEKARELNPVEDLKVWSQGGQLWLEWKPLSSTAVTEYVVEWVTGDKIDWQRENRNTNQTAIKGKLEKFVCYTVSVYRVYSGRVGKPASKEVFLEEGVPEEGPSVNLMHKPGRNEVELSWTEIPQNKRRGFITNYTIFYKKSPTEIQSVVVPGNTTSFTLKSLSSNTKYDTWIRASTIRGSINGTSHSFTTLKYAPGEIELIVVGVSLGFLFAVVMTMLLCIYKKDVIKRNFWPQIPNPGESTIGNWSPDYPLKAETPKENCLSGISVLDVDMCDGRSVFEEDKASLPLKKDKYLSEEHSSGIGGSSCMSSPRQSVSDSDEGGDMADTTASTVQYSSVVASNGYKGQTPSSQPQQAIFSRSESTQPLLDCEENPDMLVPESSRQSQRFPRQPCFRHTADSTNPADFNQADMEQQEVLEPLDFCPLEEDSEQTTPPDDQSAEWLPSAPSSSYMPQLGGYRPQ